MSRLLLFVKWLLIIPNFFVYYFVVLVWYVVLFIAFQRSFVNSIASSGVKG